MKDYADMIRQFIKETEQVLGCDLIIYDDYRVLCDDNNLKDLPQLKRWHLNEYCLKIKENPRLHNWCVSLKRYYDLKVSECVDVCKSTCYCGVTEYAVPIILNNRKICIVAAAGYLGETSKRIDEMLSKCTRSTPDELRVLREKALIICDGEKEIQIKTYLRILAILIKEYILQNRYENIFCLKTINQETQSRYIFKALEFIQQNFTRKLSIDEIANECHISSSYLQHIFIEQKGYGISQEIRNCRLQYACELLCTTEYSIKYVALSCGYQNVDYFSTVFRKQYGLAPLKYRNKYSRKTKNSFCK